MRNLLKIFIVMLLLAGSYSEAGAQEEPQYQLWMAEGRSYLDGRYGKEKRDEAIKWFRRVKRRCYFNKTIRGQAMRGIADYQLYKGDTAAAIKTLRQVMGKRIAHKIETGSAGKLRKRKQEEWNRYYAACSLTEIYLSQNEFERARLFTAYADTIVFVSWTCGIGIIMHDSWVMENMLRYWIGIEKPEEAYAYWYGHFLLEDNMLTSPENARQMDSLMKYDVFNSFSGTVPYPPGKADSLICKTLINKYTKPALRDSFNYFGRTIQAMDTVMESGLKVRIYYGYFLGKQIRITARISDEKSTPITPEQDKEYRKEAERLIYRSWIYNELN